MEECRICKSKRLVSISGKTSDCFGMGYDGKDYDGYVPNGIGIGGGDYVEFTYCLDCGQIQGDFPIPEEKISENFIDDEYVE